MFFVLILNPQVFFVERVALPVGENFPHREDTVLLEEIRNTIETL